MKRSMPRITMCIKCFEPVQVGWNQAHHTQHCKGRPTPTNFTQGKKTFQPSKDDQDTNEQLTNVDDPRQDEHEDEGQNMHLGGDTAIHEVGVYAAPAQLRASITPKTKEILEFLSTAEMGEGCSREHAQAWLDYHKKKGGPSSRLLPKDIRTCWDHVAKVYTCGHLPVFAFALCRYALRR
jgi:hypothetical protein